MVQTEVRTSSRLRRNHRYSGGSTATMVPEPPGNKKQENGNRSHGCGCLAWIIVITVAIMLLRHFFAQ